MKPCWHNVVGPDDLHERSPSNSRLPLLSWAYPNQIPPSIPRRLGTQEVLVPFWEKSVGAPSPGDFTLVW